MSTAVKITEIDTKTRNLSQSLLCNLSIERTGILVQFVEYC